MAKALAFLLAGLVIFVGGSTLGVGMVLEAQDDRRVLAEGVRTTGVITKVEFYTDRRRHSYKDLTVYFLTEDRRVYGKRTLERYYDHVEGPESTVADQMHGEKRVVFYDRSDPGNSVIEGATQSFTVAYLVILLAAGFGAAFIRSGWVGLRRRQA
ncbi:DUF3592 domain-containing protein [Arthrobacter jiangjiafuii]|uniref:DUF3592 domain-containing protein n=1 Tax=Arthrobacter jiangjiafuii TaxID=2817475 RepID=A0A975R280_9MICC|nr:DUF3592 domain-containing protein [Arthrobacter jiangjiafuii]MBP3044362.1 DUF3592 domain-containing protein [Arthrobacter jiangjiafuii]QWC11313.1 DUF3592 domain-containing protein [Arthrobacter jiangjiafuii]